MPDLCLIFEPLRVVAKDLAATLRDLTGCDPLLATSEVEALMQLGTLAPDTPLTTAFVHLDARSFQESPLKALLEQRGARIVLTATQAGHDHATLPWPVLPRPFATADVHRVLAAPA